MTFWQICNFRDSSLVTFYFQEMTHFLDWMKKTSLFICTTNIVVRLLTVNMKNCLTQKNPKMCDPILVTLLKMQPHSGQSSRENVTPSSGTSSLASYKEVHPPGVYHLTLAKFCGTSISSCTLHFCSPGAKVQVTAQSINYQATQISLHLIEHHLLKD